VGFGIPLAERIAFFPRVGMAFSWQFPSPGNSTHRIFIDGYAPLLFIPAPHFYTSGLAPRSPSMSRARLPSSRRSASPRRSAGTSKAEGPPGFPDGPSVCIHFWEGADYIPIPWPPGAPDSSFSFGRSATIASVVSISEATDAEFCSANRDTLVGSITPAWSRSSY